MGNSEFQKPITGSFTATSQTIDITSPNSGTSVVQITGTWDGEIVLEGSNDDSNWFQLNLLDNSTKLFTSSLDSNGVFLGPTNGFQFIRLRTSSWTSGTASIDVYGSDAVSVLNTDSQIRGSSDGTLIGNSGDKLKVTNTPASGSDIIPSLGTNLYYDDMNTNSGGVARGTLITNSWTKIYDSTLAPTAGTSGLMTSFILTLEKIEDDNPAKSWVVRMVVDGVEVFGSNGILSTDLINKDIYGFIVDPNKSIPEWSGFSVRESSLKWEGPINLPIKYSSGVQIYLKKLSDNKVFRAGLVTLTKD